MHCAHIASLAVLLAALTSLALGQDPPQGRVTGSHGNESSGGDMVIMSFNIRYGTAPDGANAWAARRGLVWDLLRTHDPDVIGLQEALRFQLDELRENVPGYAEIGVGRNDGQTHGEYAAILFRTARFRTDEHGTFWLSDTPEQPGSKSWGNTIPRICTWAHFIDKQNGCSFYIYNVHLDHQSQRSRERSVELLAVRIAARTHRDDPVIITGDFNAGEDNAVIRFVKGEIPRAVQAPGSGAGTGAASRAQTHSAAMRFIDTFRAVHPDAEQVGTFHGFRGGRSSAKIDYVFADPDIAVHDAVILYDNSDDQYPSDHYPVMARINLRAERTDAPQEDETAPAVFQRP
jgi:endonuclease/exonuclease/phosphatase family metal-dependent hydrolase